MQVPPETRYVKLDAGYVGYQTFGHGPPACLFVTNWLQNLDVMWAEPTIARYFRRLSSFSQVVCFDKRGSGISDPVPLDSIPSLETWMDDAVRARDASGVGRAAGDRRHRRWSHGDDARRHLPGEGDAPGPGEH